MKSAYIRTDGGERSDGGERDRPSPGREVRFRLGDLICPDYQQVLAELGPDVDLNGRIEYLSDRGEDKEFFAVVSVEGVTSPVVVPLDRLYSRSAPESGEKTAI